MSPLIDSGRPAGGFPRDLTVSIRLEGVHSPSILDYPFETTNLGGTDFDGV